ncbi:AraC family transcriptional regulator [Psychromonas sp. psych-6C06]|uniref:AraC family transcriptional regulator n=1 Tax=Psychromonas sp. psych-6C06 TaxID=2058089 RepID=UPI000C3498ED|nr:GyrI-like domain-containing protein [Psychromonas sp. psych-6C06]PKF62272.1 AraC family transcriptional regulator [Psychromonas sp. psych-6C06]
MENKKTNYQQKLKPVFRYLEANFKEPLNLQMVAEKAYLSPYHFHRIFKVVSGETLAGYLRRLKLEYAAQQLFYTQQSITEIALTLGFSSSQSFAKAIRQYFGLSASQIRNCTTPTDYRALLQKSKIGHLLHNNGNANHDEGRYAYQCDQQQEAITMKIETINNKLLAYIRVTGPYGEGYQQAIGKLYQWAALHSFEQGESLFIYHDNPEITPAEKCRTDICISVPEGTQVTQGIEIQPLPAGRYSSIRENITDKKQYRRCWEKLMSQIIEADLAIDERPCFEFYHHYDPQTEEADVSFYTAIK